MQGSKGFSSGDFALLLGRLFVGGFFLIAAYNQMKGYDGVLAFWGKLGIPVPATTLPVVMIL